MTNLATIEELAERLPFVMDEGEEREATLSLEILSDDARHYGSSAWQEWNAPRQVKTLVLKAAARHMKNYEGFTTSRAGDETVQWTDRGEDSGSAHFTRSEKQQLAEMSGRLSGLVTVRQVAWGNQRSSTTGFVPVDHPGEPFPMFASGDDPW